MALNPKHAAHMLALQSAQADNSGASWEDLTAMWSEEKRALPPAEERNKHQVRQAERLDWFRTSKSIYDDLKRNAIDTTQKLLDITHVQGEANKAQSSANEIHSQTTAKLDIIPAPDSHVSPGVENLVKEIRKLHAKKNPDYVESGVLFWCVLDTDDFRRMNMVSREVRRTIMAKIEGALQISRGPQMSFLLDEDTWREQRSIRSIAKAVTTGGIRQLWSELKSVESAMEAACEDEEVAYLGRCFQDMAAYTARYAHRDLKNERNMDMHAVASFAKLPGAPLLF
ncbi:hypothetical protein HDU86_008441 [Geranomyces michiganensis]|nr:hypothetical protein HDU86_008441 [Geranomyces michiganensis]